MNYFKHPNALVESQHIGKGTHMWAFAHILSGAAIGEDCNICDHVFNLSCYLEKAVERTSQDEQDDFEFKTRSRSCMDFLRKQITQQAA
jgi:NDP-sugar pyrophosphorylase family protein